VKLLTTGFFTIRWGTLGASWSTILGLLATLFVLVRQSDAAINCFVRERNFLKKLLLSLAIMMLSLLVYQGIISILFQGVHHR
ncbi:polysaccharide biosynthesis C-terminal domain-containing protein, partial [Klebsiella pneumoniae]